jgi:predicted RND superfamily exporter protein
MERYLEFVQKYARSIIFLLVAVTAGFAGVLGSLTFDTNPYLLKESHPARKTIIALQDEFTGTYDSVMIAIHNPAGIFNKTSLNALYAMSQASRRVILSNDDDAAELRKIIAAHAADSDVGRIGAEILKGGLAQNDYRQLAQLRDHAGGAGWSPHERQFLRFLAERVNPIREMASMADMENIVLAKGGELLIHKTLHAYDMDPKQVEAEIMSNELLIRGAVSEDKTSALLVVELGTKQDDAVAQVRAYDRFREIVAGYQREHPEFRDEVFIAGMPIFIAAQQEVMDHDLGLLFPIVFLLVAGLLVFFLRKPFGVLLPLLNILFCTIWTLGLMAIFEVPVDLLTSVLPVFLVTLCCADAIHLMSEYYEQRGKSPTSREAARRTMRMMVMPVVLTTATTTATFLISTSTNIVSIRNFGLFMAIGLLVAQIISLLLIPAWLSQWGHVEKSSWRVASEDSPISHALVRGCRWLIRHRRGAIACVAPFFVTMAILSFFVDIEDSGIAYFRQDSPVRVSDDFVNKNLAGTSPGWIAIDSKVPCGVLNTETVDFIDRLDRFLRAQPEINYHYSLATYIKRMNLVLNDMDHAFSRVPGAVEKIRTTDEDGKQGFAQVDGNALIDQHVMMFENGGGSDLTNVLNPDYSKALTLYTMNSSVASDYRAVLQRVDAWLEKNKPPHIEITHAGTPVIWTGVLEEITRGQVLSFTLAVLVVTLMMMAWLRSVRLGLLGMIILLATSAAVYGGMFLMKIELNIGTVLATFLVVGVVDYAVHLLSRIKLHVIAGAEIDGAILHAMSGVGRSTVVNVVIFSMGFLALLFSDYKPIVDLGMLVALALSTGGVITILLVTLISPWFFAPLASRARSAQRVKALHAGPTAKNSVAIS